jgi:hypothetical protein
VSDPIRIERLFRQPLNVEPLMTGAPNVIAIGGMVGPFGPVSMAATTVAITIDGGGNVIIPGDKADLPINWNGKITGWMLISDLAGNASVDILVGDPVNGIPYASITGGNTLDLTAVSAAAGNVAGWNPDLSSGDVLRYHVASLNTIRRLTVALFVERD